MIIKALYITSQTQGQRNNDFCCATEGELAFGPCMDCTNETTDGNCGCKRALTGVHTLMSATTFVVGEFPGNRADWIEAVTIALKAGGWFDGGWAQFDWRSEISKMADFVLLAVQRYPIGTILERRETGLVPRVAAGVA